MVLVVVVGGLVMHIRTRRARAAACDKLFEDSQNKDDLPTDALVWNLHGSITSVASGGAMGGAGGMGGGGGGGAIGITVNTTAGTAGTTSQTSRPPPLSRVSHMEPGSDMGAGARGSDTRWGKRSSGATEAAAGHSGYPGVGSQCDANNTATSTAHGGGASGSGGGGGGRSRRPEGYYF